MAQTALITGVGRLRGIGAGIAAGLAADAGISRFRFGGPMTKRLGLAGAADDPDRLADELQVKADK